MLHCSWAPAPEEVPGPGACLERQQVALWHQFLPCPEQVKGSGLSRVMSRVAQLTCGRGINDPWGLLFLLASASSISGGGRGGVEHVPVCGFSVWLALFLLPSLVCSTFSKSKRACSAGSQVEFRGCCLPRTRVHTLKVEAFSTAPFGCLALDPEEPHRGLASLLGTCARMLGTLPQALAPEE